MNKKLLVLAVSAALAGTSFSAMAETKIYGKAHVSLDSLSDLDMGKDSDGDGTNDESGLFISSNASRIGFTGDVDAGEGLKAVWKIEQGVALDSGGASISNYNSYAGLSGGFGTVIMGYHDNPVKLVGRKFDLFGDTIADARSMTGPGGGANSEARLPDVLAYMNKFGDVGLLAAYVPEDNNGEGFGAFAFSVDYSNKDMYFGLGYHALTPAGDGTETETATRLVGSMKFGMAKVNLMYTAVDAYGNNADNSRAVMGLGGAFNLGSGAVKLQYVAAGANDNAAVDDGATMIALGYDHKLSKAVTVYAVYATVSNDDAGSYKVGGGGHGSAKETSAMVDTDGTMMDNSGISFGTVYKF